MRKILIILLIVLLCVLLGYTVTKGVLIFNFNVDSFTQIKDANDYLDRKIDEATSLTSIEYPGKLKDLENTSKKLVTIREQYERKIAYSDKSDIEKAKQLTEFEVDFLFAKLGTYVRKEGVKINITYTPDSTRESGNLHFVVVGKYIPITEFVRDIEDDERLYFAIENFVLEPLEGSSGEILIAQFDVNAIKLNADHTIENPDLVYSSTTNENETENNETSSDNKKSESDNDNQTNN